MKKMSDILSLPINGYDLRQAVKETSHEEDNDIAHAINHVDALADALEMLMDWNVKNVTIEHHPIYDIAHSKLAAYRGGK